MSDLHNQLDRAKLDYESARYPGDLASDVLIGRRSRSQPFWRIGIAVAAAASVALAIWVWPTSSDIGLTHRRVIAIAPTTVPMNDITIDSATAEVAASIAPIPASQAMPELPTFPSELPSMPDSSISSMPAFPASPGMPSFDSLSEPSTSQKEPT